MSGLRQETIAIIGVGIAAITLGLSAIESLRAEAREDRDAIRAEMREDRAEARADRERFEREILRLTRGQGILFGLIEGGPQERREPDEAPGEAPPPG